MSTLINTKDLEFLVYDVFKAEKLTEFELYNDHDKTTFDGVIETCHKIALEYFLPHNAKADSNEPTFDGEVVTTIPEVKEAWKAFSGAGLINARHSFDEGGMQLPALVESACMGIITAANPSSAGYPFLTCAAANLIHEFGDDAQKELYLPGMFSGRFSRTMALTEPAVGSSLGDLTTKAVPTADGTYRLKGQMMYISGGDQDITENIIHLVLARVEGAPSGVKGISLFIAPKYLVNNDQSLAERNDVQLAGLLHKMGYRGTTSTVLNFGEKDNCTAYLIGEEGKGLSYMFKMMNEARIGVGLGAAMIGYRGYLESLAFAKDRPQGRKPSASSAGTLPVNIIEHSDVKRMLLAQKSYVEGSLALCLFASRLVDEHEADNNENSLVLLDLLTPVVKSFPSIYGTKANELAIQVLGGSGYIREYPVEQCYRDNRLNPIHEGTQGIQSLDLLGRKLWQKNGLGQKLLMERIQETLQSAASEAELKELVESYQGYLKLFIETTTLLGMTLQSGKVEEALANSAVYLDMMGKMVIAWLWIEMSDVAIKKFRASDAEDDQAFMAGKLQAARYFLRWELPEIKHQADILKSLDDTCASMSASWF